MGKLRTEKFQNRNSFTKSGTLKLEPVGKTLDTIKSNQYIESGIQLMSKIEYLREYINKYMAAMTGEALERFAYPSDIGNDAEKLKKDIAKYLTKAMKDVSYPTTFDEKWILETIPAWLKRNGFVEQAVMFDDLKGKLSLVSHLVTTYQTALSNWIPERVCENYVLYSYNREIYERILQEDVILEEFQSFKQQNKDMIHTMSTADGYCLFVTQFDIDYYNKYISGEYDEDGTRLTKGLNQLINELNNKIKTENIDIPKFKTLKRLYKQIFSEATKAFTIDTVSSDQEAVEILADLLKTNESVVAELQDTFLNMLEDDLYVKGNNLGSLSHAAFTDANFIHHALSELYTEQIKTDKGTAKQKEKNIEKIPAVINGTTYSIAELEDITNKDISANLIEYLDKLVADYKKSHTNLVQSNILNEQKIKGYRKNISIIKDYLDSVQKIRRFFVTFSLSAKDEIGFSNEAAQTIVDNFATNTKALNLIRNYVTKNLSDGAKKIPMFFNTALKLNARWHKECYEKFAKYDHMLLKMEDKYYLFTLCHNTKPVVLEKDNDCVQYISIDKPQPMYQILPKNVFSKNVKAFFTENPDENSYLLDEKVKEPILITRDLYEIKEKKLYSKATGLELGLSEEEIIENKNKLVALYLKYARNCLLWTNFHSRYDELSDNPNDYRDLGELCNQLDSVSISMKWVPVSRKQIEGLVESGQALLFLIKNENMYKEKGRKTSYAKYLLQALSDDNVERPNMVLNARPKIFYRTALIEPRVAHQKGSELIAHTYLKNGERITIPDNIRFELYQFYNGRLAEKDLSKEALELKDIVRHYPAKQDITYRKRFSEEQFTICFSYTFNKQVSKLDTMLNTDVSEVLEGENIMSLHRGTKHLLTYTLHKADGTLLESDHLDVIHGVDYAEKLTALTKQRTNDKKDWIYDTKSSIVKDKYIQDVSSIISKIAIENNARILLESVSTKSRQTWARIDNQVFGKLEECLTNKLNCYVDETNDFTNPYQFSNVEMKGRKKGLLIMMPATSDVVDPQTGFVNLFDRRSIHSNIKKRKFLEKMDVRLKDDKILYHFSYDDFDCYKLWENGKQVEYTGKKEWTLIASGERTVYNKNRKRYDYIPDIAQYVLDVLKENDNFMEGKVDIGGISNKGIDALYEAFDIVLNGTVKECKEVSAEYRVSPITTTIYKEPSIEKCKLQTKKYLLSLQNEEQVIPSQNEWYASLQQ